MDQIDCDPKWCFCQKKKKNCLRLSDAPWINMASLKFKFCFISNKKKK